MAKRSYARRYAQAVFEIALESKKLDRWQSDLEVVAGLGGDAEVVALLQSSRLNFDDKAKILAEGLHEIDPLALNLVYLLMTRGRVGIISDIAEEYQHLVDSYRGVEHASVTTVVPLSDEEKLRLKERLSALVGKEVVLDSEVDLDIIGGVVIRVGGKLVDGSTRSQLLALKRELVGVGR